MARVCHHCGREWIGEAKVGRGAICACGMPLRCCLNCLFYDVTKHNQCAEPAAERVVDKSKANFCDQFVFRVHGSGQGGTGQKKSPADRFKDLFKD